MHLMILLLALDLTTIRNEPNLEHRSDLALDYANTAIDGAREALNAGEDAKFLAALGEAREAVELSWHSLTDSGKYARNSNSFKRAEVRTRGLMRRLDGLRDIAGIDEKTEIEKVHARVAEIHDELIQGIMGKKVKKQE